MALVNFNFESEYLMGNTNVSIILPDKPRKISPEDFYDGTKYKVLWLLHGTFGDNSDWVRKSNIELYACERDLIVVMPSALNSNYYNWASFGTGFYMYDFLIKELMPVVYNWFPASNLKEDNYIAGLSMGGFGALTYGLNYPNLFNGIGVLSAAALSPERFKVPPTDRDDNTIKNAGGFKAYENSYQDSWNLIKNLNKTGGVPDMYVSIGTDDFMYKEHDGEFSSYGNVYKDFKKMIMDENIPAKFVEHKNYAHEWRFWDRVVEEMLDYFKIENISKGNEF